MTGPSQEEQDDILIRAQNLVEAQKCQLPLLCLSPSLFTDVGLCDFFFETHSMGLSALLGLKSYFLRWAVTST